MYTISFSFLNIQRFVVASNIASTGTSTDTIQHHSWKDGKLKIMKKEKILWQLYDEHKNQSNE